MGTTRQFFLFGFYCCCLLFNCEGKLTGDGNQVITPGASLVVDKSTLDELWKNFGQKWSKRTALGDRQVPKGKLAVSDEVRIVGRPGMGDFVENGQLSTGKLNRRWARSARREGGGGPRDSGFPRDRGEDQHSRERQADDDTFQGKVEELAKNLKVRIDQRLVNLSDLFPIKNGNHEIGIPGQPVKKILDFILEKLKPKPEENEDHRLVKRLLDNAKGAAGVGIHRAVKVGPLSLSFDVGKP